MNCYPFQTTTFRFLGCALIQIPDFVLSLYAYLCGNITSEQETRQLSKKEMKRTLKSNEQLNANFEYHVDPKTRSCGDKTKCNDKVSSVRNQISPMENSCAARLDRIEKIIFGHFE